MVTCTMHDFRHVPGCSQVKGSAGRVEEWEGEWVLGMMGGLGEEEMRKYNFRRKDGTKRHYKRMGRSRKRDERETVDGTGGR
jgi:hypothetical protein